MSAPDPRHDPSHLLDHEWTLRITSFIGTVPWAKHHRAELRRTIYAPLEVDVATTYDERLEVEGKMDEAWAADLTNQVSLFGDTYNYEAGEYTGRFLSEEAAREKALALFVLIAQPGDYLVDDFADEDEPVLAGEEPEDRHHRPWKGAIRMGFLGEGVEAPRDVIHDTRTLEESRG